MNIRLLVPAALLVGVGAWGFNRWSFAQSHESTDNAQVEGHIVPIVAKVGGYVTVVTVGENAHVAHGGELVRVDAREYDVRLAQAEAELAAARAAAGGGGMEGQAVTVVRTASNQRDVGAAQVEAARTQVTRTRGDLVRAKELAAKQIISVAQLDAAQAASLARRRGTVTPPSASLKPRVISLSTS